MVFLRKKRPPAEVQNLISADDKAIAWGEAVGGSAVVAARSGLLVESADGVKTLPWHLIDAARWDPPTFTFKYRPELGAPLREMTVALQTVGELPPAINEGVTRTVLLTERRELLPGSSAVISARKDHVGTIRWTVTFDPGVNAEDPQIVAAAHRELEQVRGSAGY